MKPYATRLLALSAVALVSATLSGPAADAPNFNGEYTMKDAGTFLHLAIEQKGAALQFAFDAGRDNGQGAAPEGTGSGSVSGNRAQVKFRDSEGNSGTGTIVHAGASALTLTLQATHTGNAKAAEFYSKPMQLKQTAKEGHLQR